MRALLGVGIGVCLGGVYFLERFFHQKKCFIANCQGSREDNCFYCEKCCIIECMKLKSDRGITVWSRDIHFFFPRVWKESILTLLCVFKRKRLPFRDIIPKIVQYMAWNLMHCEDHFSVCSSKVCTYPADKVCDHHTCATHCKISFCLAHGDRELCRKCGSSRRNKECFHSLCNHCCKNEMTPKTGTGFQSFPHISYSRGGPSVFQLQKCRRHQGRCCVGQCDEKRECDEGKCFLCCTLAWCVIHGDPFVCRLCTNTSFDNGCSHRYCKRCCKKSRKYAFCSLHRTLCRDPQCLTESQSPVCNHCLNCCSVAWCKAHGDPFVCRLCTNTSFDNGCSFYGCGNCCKSSSVSHLKCVTHKTECVNCNRKRALKCDSRACGRCCKDKWCKFHGNPLLCRKCEHRNGSQSCSFCSKCCDNDRKCFVHFKCISCKNLRDIHCTDSECEDCCENKTCFHAFCKVCRKNRKNTRCDSLCCGKCCKATFCNAHGNPNLCRDCEEENFTKDCSYLLCQECCDFPDREHCVRHSKMCVDCGNNLKKNELDCLYGCCASCCCGDDCEEHNKRWFGSFQCKCGKRWKSAYAYKGWTQQCRSCKKRIYAKSFVDLQKSDSSDESKPHDVGGCQRCQAGKLCQSYSTSRYSNNNNNNSNNNNYAAYADESHYEYDHDYW